jgi:hypothetical protein
VSDTWQGDLGKVLAGAFDALGREAQTLRCVHNAKDGRAGGPGSRKKTNCADGKLETVMVGDGGQTSGGTVGFVALTDLSHEGKLR